MTYTKSIKIFCSAAFCCLIYSIDSTAQDFTVLDGQTEGQQQMLSSGDIGTVEAGGTIEFAGPGPATAVQMGDDAADIDQLLDNFGTITTTGDSVFGVVSIGDDAVINNSGRVETVGEEAHAIISLGGDAAINNSGTVETTGDESHGIWAQGDNAVIVNDGTVSTQDAHAIYSSAEDDNSPDQPEAVTIINNGLVKNNASSRETILARGDHATIINNGRVTNPSVGGAEAVRINGNHGLVDNRGTIINDGHGIRSNGFANTIINSGEIRLGESSSNRGIEVNGQDSGGDDRTTVENSGTIIVLSASSGRGMEIKEAPDAEISNSGLVLVTGENSTGILIHSGSSNASVENSGRIRVTGVGSEAVDLHADGATFTNSGLVVSELGDALLFRTNNADDPDPDGVILNLNAPSFLGGHIKLARDTEGDAEPQGPQTTVNIATGPSHSVLWEFEGNIDGGAPNVSGRGDWFYNSSTQQFATFDHSILASEFDLLADMTRILSHLNRPGGGGENGGGDGGTYGADWVSPDAAVVAPAAAMDPANNFWFAGFGGVYDHDGDGDGTRTLDRKLDLWGVAGGVDWHHSASTRFGLMAGYVEAGADADSRFVQSFDTSVTGWIGGASGRHDTGMVVVDFGITGGFLSHDQWRFVNDNLQQDEDGRTMGEGRAEASYDSLFLSPEVSVSKDFALLGDWLFTPSAGLRYAGQWLDGYSESGSAANARVDDRTLGLLEGRIEAAATRRHQLGSIGARIGALSRTSVGDDDVSMTIIGDNGLVAIAASDDPVGYAGLAAAINLGEMARLELDAEAQAGPDTQGYWGSAKLAVNF